MMKMMMMMDGSEENACCLWHATTIILLHKVIVAVSCASKWNNNTGWWYFSTFFVSSLVIYRPGHAESPLCVRIQDEPHSTIIHNVWESHVETISLIILCTHTHTERLLLWTPIRMNCMNETRVSNVHSPQKERSQPNTIFFRKRSSANEKSKTKNDDCFCLYLFWQEASKKDHERNVVLSCDFWRRYAGSNVKSEQEWYPHACLELSETIVWGF